MSRNLQQAFCERVSMLNWSSMGQMAEESSELGEFE